MPSNQADLAVLSPGAEQSQTLAPVSVMDAGPLSGHSPAILARTIESEIIPRLLLAHGAPRRLAEESLEPAPAFSSEDIAALADKALNHSAGGLVASLLRMLAGGVKLEDLYLDLLAPAARLLGARWDADRVTFADVTIALCHLQEAVHELAAEAPPRSGPLDRAPRALLAPAPREQHTFGLAILGDLFAQAGWDVRCEPRSNAVLLSDWAAEEHLDLLALTVACETHLEQLPGLIRALRRDSLNPCLRIMVGGYAIRGGVEQVHALGADATAGDGREAVIVAAGLIERAGVSGRA